MNQTKFNFLILIWCFFKLNQILCQDFYLRLYTKKEINSPIPPEDKSINISMGNALNVVNDLKNGSYLCWTNKADCTSYYIIHGFTSSSYNPWVINMKNELFKKHEKTGLINVFAVQWPSGNKLKEYDLIRESVSSWAKELSKLTDILFDSNYLQNIDNTLYLHCIGHSLGSHFCGIFGKEFKNVRKIPIRRITGLDPAGRNYDKVPETEKLNKKDALFVDAIYTSDSLGISKNIAHLNFYPNWDPNKLQYFKYQPGCALQNPIEALKCNHGRAIDYFSASINNCTFKAYECKSFDFFLNKKCINSKSLDMGLRVDTTVKDRTDSLFFLKTSSDSTTPPFCETGCFHSTSNKLGICSSNKNYKDCNRNKDCNFGNENKYKCCLNEKNKIIRKDLAFIIDITESERLTNELFSKSIDFVSKIIRRSEISPTSTRIALIVFSNSKTQIIKHFKDNLKENEILNTLRALNLEPKKENQKHQLEDALKESEKVFLIENGMREMEKGFGKQVILVSGEISDKAYEIEKKIKTNGIDFINIVSGKAMQRDSIEFDYSTFYLETLEDETFDYILEIIHELMLDIPAFVLASTNEININEDQTFYYQFPVQNVKTTQIRIILEIFNGDVQIFFSFFTQKPSEISTDDDDDLEQNNLLKDVTQESSTIKKIFEVKRKSSILYVGVDGKLDKSSFRIKIEEISSNASIKRSKKIFLILNILYCLLFYFVK